MLTCKEVTNRASDYIDDELDGVSRLKLRLHLLTCRHCRRFMRQMRATIGLLGSGIGDKPPAPMSDDLVAAYKARSVRKSDKQN